MHTDSGFNTLNTGYNPLLNVISVPTGQVFRPGQRDPTGFGAGTYGDYANVEKGFQRMERQMPDSAWRVMGQQSKAGNPGNQGVGPLPNARLGDSAQAALDTNIGGLRRQLYDRNRIGLLRSPITTAGPQLQLSAQIGAAETMRDQESLANLFLQNALGLQNLGLERIMNVLRLF